MQDFKAGLKALKASITACTLAAAPSTQAQGNTPPQKEERKKKSSAADVILG